jgi:hypothetical protein
MSYVLSIPLVNSIDAELEAVAVDKSTGLPVGTADGKAVTDDNALFPCFIKAIMILHTF